MMKTWATVFLIIVMVPFVSQAAEVAVEPTQHIVYYPDEVIVEFEADDLDMTYGFQLAVEYNESLLKFESLDEGGYLSRGDSGDVFCTAPRAPDPGEVHGFACTRIVSGDLAGDGILAVMTFSFANSSINGTSFVNITDLRLANSQGLPVSTNISDGEVTLEYCENGVDYDCGPDNELGICKIGTRTCSGGNLSVCVGAVMPEEEVCDGVDNDCSGIIDDVNGRLSIETSKCGCFNGTAPGSESCPHNGIDDDCDQEIDENTCQGDPPPDDDGGGINPGGGGGGCNNGERQPCTYAGVCKPSYRTCSYGVFGQCEGPAPDEEICDGKDNDCDDSIDNGLTCLCIQGDTRACGPHDTEIGACKFGIATCDGQGEWGECIGATYPDIEMCDGFDNDCDGEIDEECISDECSQGKINRPDGCLCGGSSRTYGFCCSGLWYDAGCPMEWSFLILAGVIILIVLYILVIIFKREGKELTWKTLMEKYKF